MLALNAGKSERLIGRKALAPGFFTVGALSVQRYDQPLRKGEQPTNPKSPV